MTAPLPRTVVIDTSVLLGDPASLQAFPNCDIVLPLTVIEELDKKKDRQDDVGTAARTVIRMLEELRVANPGGLSEPARFGESTVRVETNGLQRKRVEDYGFDIDRADNRILAACLGLGEHTGGPVELVTNDVALRIKASQIGLQASGYVPQANVNDVGIGKGWTTIEVAPSLIDAMYANNFVDPYDDELPDDVAEAAGDLLGTIATNEFAVLRAGPSRSVLVRRFERHGCSLLRRLPEYNSVNGLAPKSKEQAFALDLLTDPDVQVIALDGRAGTGKTLLALAAGLAQAAPQHGAAVYDKVAVYRPMVSVEKNTIGFLPGELDEKLAPWMEAVTDALTAMTGNYSQAKNLMSTLLTTEKLTLNAVTFLRGRTLHSTYILVDEAQNLEVSTLKTILTRAGAGSKLILNGDTDQIDQPYLSKENNALSVLRNRFHGQSLFGHITLTAYERSEVAALAAELL